MAWLIEVYPLSIWNVKILVSSSILFLLFFFFTSFIFCEDNVVSTFLIKETIVSFFCFLYILFSLRYFSKSVICWTMYFDIHHIWYTFDILQFVYFFLKNKFSNPNVILLFIKFCSLIVKIKVRADLALNYKTFLYLESKLVH